MFLWGIDGQIWAVLWAVFNYKQLQDNWITLKLFMKIGF